MRFFLCFLDGTRTDVCDIRRGNRRNKKFKLDCRLSLGAVYGLQKGLVLQLYWMGSLLFPYEWQQIRSKRMIECWAKEVYFMGWNGQFHERLCHGCQGQCSSLVDRLFSFQ